LEYGELKRIAQLKAMEDGKRPRDRGRLPPRIRFGGIGVARVVRKQETCVGVRTSCLVGTTGFKNAIGKNFGAEDAAAASRLIRQFDFLLALCEQPVLNFRALVRRKRGYSHLDLMDRTH